MSIEIVVDWLVYKAYEYNRINNPDIEASQWEVIFPDAKEYESILENKRRIEDGK